MPLLITFGLLNHHLVTVTGPSYHHEKSGKRSALEGEHTFMRTVASRHQGDSCAPSPSAQMFSNIRDRSTSITLNEQTRCDGLGSAAEGVVNGSVAINMRYSLCCSPRPQEHARCAGVRTRAWSPRGGLHHSRDHIRSHIDR
jgi:hypothetical protein